MTTGPGFPQPDYEPPPPLGGAGVVDAGPRVKAPAICLAVVGGLTFAFDAWATVSFVTNPSGAVRDMQHIMELLGLSSSNSDAEIRTMLSLSAALTGLLAVGGLVSLVGGIQMARLRSRGLAIAGACVAMVSIANFCCAAGLPVGIWAMVVLMKPEIAQAFAARRSPPGA